MGERIRGLLGKLQRMMSYLGCLNIRAVQVIRDAVGTSLSGHLASVT